MLRACLISLALNSALAHVADPAETAAPPPAVYVKPAAPGELIDIGGRRLHIECKGDAKAPPVIFEAGLSQFTAHSTYGKAQDLIAPFAYVCTYDRAGFGWSDEAPSPRTQQDMVEDLHRLLAAKKIEAPVVLVGHSMGGLIARLYAKTYPQQVAGMVLVDASPEGYIYAPGNAEARQALVVKIAEGLKVAKEGVPVVQMPEGTPPELMLAFTPPIFRAMQQENEAIDRIPEAMRQPQGYGMLGDLPLVVLRRGKEAAPPSEEDLSWRSFQASLAKLSTRGQLIVAENAGHVIPYDSPEVVADAVKKVLGEVRR